MKIIWHSAEPHYGCAVGLTWYQDDHGDDVGAMPEPVPPGQHAAYAAAICEGFCPACKVPLAPWPAMPEIGPRGDCPCCGANWLYSKISGQIEWRSARGGSRHWHVVVNPE